MTLGEKIQKLRKQRGLSQEALAEKVTVTRQTISKWELGSSEPTAANLAELAALFEMSISELVDPQKYAEEQEAQEQRFKEKQWNSKMLFGRWGAVVLINAGWDGYSSGLYGTDFPYYWLAILIIGLVLLFITSKDMGKRHKLELLQIVVGLIMIFSIFFLPRIIPLEHVGAKYLLADIVTAICGIILSLKYWRHIWKVK